MTVLDQTLGLLFMALVITSALFGAGCLQAYYYFRTHGKRDGYTLKLMVFVIMIFDTCQQSFIGAALYEYCVTNHGNNAILGFLPHSLIIQAIFGGLVAIVVQMFNIYRIWRLSVGNWSCIPATGFAVALSLATFLDLMIYCGKAVVITDVADLAALDTLTTLANAGAAATDVTISIMIIFLLHSSRSKTSFKRTNDMIGRLINFTLNTGSLTSVNALFAVITLKVWPTTHLYMFFYLMLGRIYTNSLLATLNARDYIRSANSQKDSWSIPPTVRGNSVPMTIISNPSRGDNDIVIQIGGSADDKGSSDKDFHSGNQKVEI